MKQITHRKILILPPAGMGDFVMAAPVIRSVRNKFPESYISVLAHHFRGAKDIGGCMPYLDEVIDFPLLRYSWTSVMWFFASSYWPMLWNLKTRQFDTVINLAQNPIRTILIKMLNPGTALEVQGKGHPTQRGLAAVAKLGCLTEPQDFGFQVPDVNIDKILPSCLSRPWIGVHPFSAICWRNWSNYADMLKRLAGTSTLVVLGQQAGYKAMNQEGVLDLVNRLSVRELIAVIASLDALISVDSGPMHLGFAVGTPTLGIFNAVEPQDRMPLVAGKSCRGIFMPVAGMDNSAIIERQMANFQSIELDNDKIYSEIIHFCWANQIDIR